MTSEQFVEKWPNTQLTQRAASHEHRIDLRRTLLLCCTCLLVFVGTVSGQRIDPASLPAEVHKPILRPIPDGIQLEIPPQLGNRKLAALGLVDVTAAPFNADPTGRKDSTNALQRAIELARDAQMVCFFPSGTYLVSDTLIARHGIVLRTNLARILNSDVMPCVLVGSRAGDARPSIRLAARSAGFNNPEKRKAVVEYVTWDVTDNKVNRSAMADNTLFKAIFANIDIEIGDGNPGAIGIRMRSAEGSAIQDVKIDARHGYAGIEGAAGNGGSWTNIEVIGGDTGLDMRTWTPPTPTMEAITLRGQRRAAIDAQVRGALVIVGLDIESDIPGPLIISRSTPWAPLDGQLNLIDASITFTGRPGRLLAKPTRSTHLANVYVRNAAEVIEGHLSGDPGRWVHVAQCAIGIDSSNKGYNFDASPYIDGKQTDRDIISISRNVTPPGTFSSRHTWNDPFPSWETPGAANVKEAPYNAVGDSFADDTAAIQAAINASDTVFLPKGYYRLSRTLHLRHNTRLVGVAQHLSVLMVRDPIPAERWPMIETADSADAQTILAFIGVRPPIEMLASAQPKHMPVYAIKWQSGRHSIFRTVDVNPLRVYGFAGSKDHANPPYIGPTILITGHGGGRWYNYHTSHGWMNLDPNNRCIRIERNAEPIWFYNFEPQYSTALTLADLIGARDVSIFGCKTECDTTFLHIVESDRIRVFGIGGLGNGSPQRPLFTVDNTPNFLISTIADQANLGPDQIYLQIVTHRNVRTWDPLRETWQGTTIELPPLARPVLYQRGALPN